MNSLIRRGAWAGLAVAVVFVFSACSSKVEDQRTASQLVNDGMAAYEDSDYNDAIDAFEKLKDWYPFSKWAILAELKLADAYYHRGSWDDAIIAYEHFERMHPKNEAVPYVIYQIGMCYFEQMPTHDRDQTPTRQAAAHFQRLRRLFPEDPYSHKAADHLLACLTNLARHDYYVGRFYFKMDKYKAAKARFESVLSSYPDVGVQHDALEYLALCNQRINAAKAE